LAFAEPHLGPAGACARWSIMMTHLGKGFWFMRGMPGKQDPTWDKTSGLLGGYESPLIEAFLLLGRLPGKPLVFTRTLEGHDCPLGRVPTGCGYSFEPSPKPSVPSDSAGHEPYKSVFRPLAHPD